MRARLGCLSAVAACLIPVPVDDFGMTVFASGAKQSGQRHDPGDRAAPGHFASLVMTGMDAPTEAF
jgi:hypothetical protein